MRDGSSSKLYPNTTLSVRLELSALVWKSRANESRWSRTIARSITVGDVDATVEAHMVRGFSLK